MAAPSFGRADTPIICFRRLPDQNKRRYEKELLDDLHARGLGRLVVFGGEETSTWHTNGR